MTGTNINGTGGGVPGELAWGLYFFAARVVRGPKRAGRSAVTQTFSKRPRLDKFMAGGWEALGLCTWHSASRECQVTSQEGPWAMRR